MTAGGSVLERRSMSDTFKYGLREFSSDRSTVGFIYAPPYVPPMMRTKSHGTLLLSLVKVMSL